MNQFNPSPVGSLTSDPNGLRQLRAFIKTTQGKDAVRSSIDGLVMQYKMTGQASPATHTSLVQNLMRAMQQAGGYGMEAAMVDPMNVAAAQHRGFSSQDY